MRAFKGLRNKSNNLMNVARRVFYKDLIYKSSGDQKKLFSVTSRLLGVARITQYPPFTDKVVLAYKFGDFFAPKIVVIQNKLDNMATTVSPGSEKCLADSPVAQLWMVSEYLMNRKSRKLVEAALKKSYSIYQIPTPLVVGCIDILVPVITKSLISLYRRVHLLINGSVL